MESGEMNDFLKGNYKVKKEIIEGAQPEDDLEAEFREKAINSIGGSMVFVERDQYVWDGDEEESAQ